MKPKTIRIRRWLLILLLVAIFFVYMAQLMKIQVIDAQTYRAIVEGQSSNIQFLSAARGEIVDRNGVKLAVNRNGYDVIIDKAYMPSSTKDQNAVILRIINMFEEMDEEWIDNLPITEDTPFTYKTGYDDAVARIKALVNVGEYATADHAMHWLIERYKLEDYSAADARKIASVRYEMERRDFSIRIPYTFASDIDIQSVIRIKEHSYELPGVSVEEITTLRVYEQGDLAPHVIGSIGAIYKEEYDELKNQGKIFKENAFPFDVEGYRMDDIIGKEGVESAFEDYLRGQNGMREIITDSNGNVISANETISPVPGSTVVLTLDSNYQRVAQESLEAQIKFLAAGGGEYQARSACAGAAVMLDCKTGEILALATYPSYDLTTYRQDYAELSQQQFAPLLNRATMGQYAPGSTYKPVVGLTGLKHGTINEYSSVFCGQVYRGVPSFSFTCLSYHGGVSLRSALRQSCNIFFYDTGLKVGIDAIDNTASQLGLGEPTGIEIKEAIGQRSNPEIKLQERNEEWYSGDVVQSSIGQLLNKFTPLQLANYASTIANRGTRMELTLVHEIWDYNMENCLEVRQPKVAQQVDIAPEYFESVIAGLVDASHIGTARGTFSNYPIKVASKTGTPQTSDTEVNSTFFAFAPAEDPQIAIAVVVEKGWHGYTGAPVAKALMDEYFGIDVRSSVYSGPQQLKDQRKAEAEKQSAAQASEANSGESSSGEEAASSATEVSGTTSSTATSSSSVGTPDTSSSSAPPSSSVETPDTSPSSALPNSPAESYYAVSSSSSETTGAPSSTAPFTSPVESYDMSSEFQP